MQQNMFDHEIVGAILANLLSFLPPKDKVVWNNTKAGKFYRESAHNRNREENEKPRIDLASSSYQTPRAVWNKTRQAKTQNPKSDFSFGVSIKTHYQQR